MPTRFSTIEATVAAIRRGDVVIVVDAEDRENEGDFVSSASGVTPEIVNFRICHGRGQVCMPILRDVARRLDLPAAPPRSRAGSPSPTTRRSPRSGGFPTGAA